MAMIAFYAGLFIGILLGLLLSSLWAFSLAGRRGGVQPDQAEGYPQKIPWSLKPGLPPSSGLSLFQVGARRRRSPELSPTYSP